MKFKKFINIFNNLKICYFIGIIESHNRTSYEKIFTNLFSACSSHF